MRYIIIPLAILLYIWWSYYSIKDLVREYKNDYYIIKRYTLLYIGINGGVIIGFALSTLFHYIIKYW